MHLAPVTLTPLEPGQRRVMHLHAIVPALVPVIVGAGIGTALFVQLGWPGWVLPLLALPLAYWIVAVAPKRRFEAWGWALAADELHVAWGVWTQVHTIVPLSRVQHLDVAQGPIERANGVARLIVHTAGTAHATVVLPGITRATAEDLRDRIREHIRAEPW
ncbi:PH domain-containing protein [Sphingomonas sp. S1-29]|uniref:PH domain-containing protein n=1 Tax=Sphingomonas sp. S1-29 TaxID=2991074 RepID=UPI0022409251|nr:PH domain-containing protein [Sphingomonas sp. S1-29]UZK68525.1 PH domain-containing protein [Sphingomonas sp. S1-29]